MAGEKMPKDQGLLKEKKLPRYMQPNQAWLNKDKVPTVIVPEREPSHMAKSKGSNFFPNLALMRNKKKSLEDQLEEENLLAS